MHSISLTSSISESLLEKTEKRKHPASIALSNRILQKIDQEASRQKRSRSDWVELHFEILFFKSLETENQLVSVKK